MITRVLSGMVGALTLSVSAATSPTIATEPSMASEREPSPTAQRVDGVRPVLDRGEYFPDPYPIHKKRGWGRDLPVFSGMRMRLLSKCDGGAVVTCDPESRDKLSVTFSQRLDDLLPDEPGTCRKKKGFHPYQSNGDHPRG